MVREKPSQDSLDVDLTQPPRSAKKMPRFWPKLREAIVSCISCSSMKKPENNPPNCVSPQTTVCRQPMTLNSRARKTQSVRSARQLTNKRSDNSVKITSIMREPTKPSAIDLDRSETLVQDDKDIKHTKGRQFATFKEILAEYKLSKKPIGSGTFAVVYKGVGVIDGRTYALKFIDKKVLEDFGDCHYLIDREISVLRKVKHENCISLYKIFETKEAIVLVTDFAHGGELFARFYEVEVFTEYDALKLMTQLLNGLTYLHNKGIVHRDIKPENLLLKTLTPRLGDAKLLIADFGLAKAMSKRLEPLHTACGTPHYVAPEVLTGEGYSTPVDLWSCGILLYFLLSGYTPYQGTDQASLMESIKNDELQFLDDDWADISPEARDFITILLNPDPKTRVTAAQALEHPWLQGAQETPNNLQPKLLKNRNSQKLLQNAVAKLRAVQQFNNLLVNRLIDDPLEFSSFTLSENPPITTAVSSPV